MSRAAPSYETLSAISRAFDERDRIVSSRLPNRPTITARPIMPGEIISRLRSIASDIEAAPNKPGTVLDRELEMLCFAVRIRHLADRLEDGQPKDCGGTSP